MIILLYILLFLLFLIVVFFIISYFLIYQRMLLGEAPFVPVPNEYLRKIIETLEIKKNSVVYDLGCGDGRLLFAAYYQSPDSKFIGIEKSMAIYLLAWIRSIKLKDRNSVKIFRSDIFKKDISDATHVFTYLMPRMMQRLEPKLEKELKPGTKLVSCSFPLKGKKLSHEIDLNFGGPLAPTKLYVYDF